MIIKYLHVFSLLREEIGTMPGFESRGCQKVHEKFTTTKKKNLLPKKDREHVFSLKDIFYIKTYFLYLSKVALDDS